MLEDIVSGLDEDLRQRDSICAAYLFGSAARGALRATSDIDVGVWLNEAPPARLGAFPSELEGELSRRFGRPVQIIVMNTAPPDLVHRILRDGIMIAERDRSKRIGFEVRHRQRYLDLLPVLERYRRAPQVV